jgi:hypothetical protein
LRAAAGSSPATQSSDRRRLPMRQRGQRHISGIDGDARTQHELSEFARRTRRHSACVYPPRSVALSPIVSTHVQRQRSANGELALGREGPAVVRLTSNRPYSAIGVVVPINVNSSLYAAGGPLGADQPARRAPNSVSRSFGSAIEPAVPDTAEWRYWQQLSEARGVRVLCGSGTPPGATRKVWCLPRMSGGLRRAGARSRRSACASDPQAGGP